MRKAIVRGRGDEAVHGVRGGGVLFTGAPEKPLEDAQSGMQEEDDQGSSMTVYDCTVPILKRGNTILLLVSLSRTSVPSLSLPVLLGTTLSRSCFVGDLDVVRCRGLLGIQIGHVGLVFFVLRGLVQWRRTSTAGETIRG